MSRKRQPTASSATIEKPSRVRPILYSVAALIALLGLAETTYLTVLHLSGANIVCLGTSTCSEVLRSKWASIGPVPLASLGAMAYFLAFSCATLAAFGYQRAPLGLAVMVGIMFLTTLGLLYLQAFVLHAFCEYCLLSAAMTFLLAGIVIAIPSES